MPSAQTVAIHLRKHADGKLGKFYKGRNYFPLWAANGRFGPEADRLVGYLENADLDELKPSNYKVAELRRALDEARTGDPERVALAELRLSTAFARYASDLQLRPSREMAYLDKRLKPRKLSADAVLRRAAFAKNLKAYVEDMGWMNPHYRRMRNLLAQAQKQGRQGEDVARLRLNLNRARALPSAWTHHVVVDAVSGQLWYYQAGRQAGQMKVVVGTGKTPTPMFAGMLNYAILNPYWNIPVDLAQNSIAPKVLSGRSLKSLDIEALSDWSRSPQKLDPASIDWQAVAAGDREIRLRELPGAGNSMGRVKFLFPNDEGIYLHDTPDRDLFKKTDRHFSNGCIRLEDAAKLGQWLLGRSIKTASKTPEQAMPLPVPVPIYLTYFTATEAKSGRVAFLADVYGRDSLRTN